MIYGSNRIEKSEVNNIYNMQIKFASVAKKEVTFLSIFLSLTKLSNLKREGASAPAKLINSFDQPCLRWEYVSFHNDKMWTN